MGELARRGQLPLRDEQAISQQVMSKCIAHYLFLLGVIPLSALYYYYHHDDHHILICLNYETIPISTHELRSFLFLILISHSVCVVEGESDCVVFSCYLGLNHNTWS